MTNWGILSCLVKQTRLSWTDTQSSPYRGAQPCAAVTLHYTLGSLANIKSHQPPILACHPSSLTQLHVWNGNITAHRLSEKKRPLFFFSSLAISSRCSAVKFEIHAWILSSFLNLFLHEASSRPVLPQSTHTILSPGVFWLPSPFILPPQNLCLAGVVRLGGNGFSRYLDRGK